MSNSVSIWPTIWKFGLIIAVVRIVYSLLLYLTGLVGTTGSIVAILGSLVLLVVALKSFRGRNGGYMRFGQAFGIGFFTALIATVARAVVDSIYLATAGRDILAAQRDEMIDQMAANPGMDPETLEMMTGVMDAVFTPGGMLFLALIGGVIGWVVIALIVAAVMKRPSPAS
jgi:hypothetical protein